MPAPLPVPHVPPGFPPLATAGGPTAHPGDPTTPGTEAGDQTASPGSQPTLETEAAGQTAPRTEAGGQTTTLGSLTARTYAAPSSPASPTSAPLVRHPQIRLRPTQCPRLHPRHAQPQHLRLRPHHPRPQSPTRSTTRVALELHESHRHRLYISSRRRRRPYQWHLRSILIR
jgi:hypothetical protein